MAFLTTSPYVVLDSKMLYSSLLTGFWIAFKMVWPYLLIALVIAIGIRMLNNKIDRRNARLRKQREDEEFERRVEQFLDKKEERERSRRK